MPGGGQRAKPSTYNCGRLARVVARAVIIWLWRAKLPQSRKPLCVLLAYREFESPPLRMVEQIKQEPRDPQGERVRRMRLREDGQRPLVVNLEETILLTRKLFELRDSALRAR